MPPPPAKPSSSRGSPFAWRILVAVLFSFLLFGLTLKMPISHSDAEHATIGRIQHCGFPFPWIRYAPGISISQSLGNAKDWLLPVNLAFWVLVACLLFRLRTLRGCAACMAIAQATLWLLLLLLCL